MERLERVGECWKVGLKSSILLPACVALYHLGGWYSRPRDSPESDACLVFSFFVEPFSKERTLKPKLDVTSSSGQILTLHCCVTLDK